MGKAENGREWMKGNATVAVAALIGEAGGLPRLIARFESNGYGDAIASWIVARRLSIPLTPGQLHGAIGPDVLQSAARAAGMLQGDMLRCLCYGLPKIAGSLTPGGNVCGQRPTEAWVAAADRQTAP